MKIQWVKAGKPSFNSPALLAEYHRKFNTISIPISSPGAFFTDAVAASRDADTRADLEKKLDEIRQKRAQECISLIESIRESYYSAQGRRLPTQVREAALMASQTGSLDHLLQFITGVVFGWDGVDMKHMEPTPSLDVPGGDLSGSQYLPDVIYEPEDGHVDDGLGLDDQSWRFQECGAEDALVLESQNAHDTSRLVEEKEMCPEKEVESPAIATTTPSPPKQGIERSLPSSPLPEITEKTPHKDTPTPSPMSTTGSAGVSHASPHGTQLFSNIAERLTEGPVSKRSRPEDNDEDTLADQRAHQRRRTNQEP